MSILDVFRQAVIENNRKKYQTPPFQEEAKLPPIRAMLANALPTDETESTVSPLPRISIPAPLDSNTEMDFRRENVPPSLPPIPSPVEPPARSILAPLQNTLGISNLPPIPAPIEKPSILAPLAGTLDRSSLVDPVIDRKIPLLPPIVAPVESVPESQKIQNQISGIQNKDYSIRKDENGNVIRGADRDKDWSTGEKLGGFGLGLLNGVLSGRGLLGGLPEAISNATDRNFNEKRSDASQLSKLLPMQKAARENEEFQAKQGSNRIGDALRIAQTENIAADNKNQAENTEIRKMTLQDRRRIAERNGVLRQLGLIKRYKRGENPQFDAKLESLDIEQPDFEPGKKLKPRYWDNRTGKLMTFDDNNATVPVKDANGDEIVNDSRREVESGGYTVMPNVARSADAQVEASRVNAGNQTAINERESKVAMAKLDSKITSSQTRIAQITKSLAEMENLTGIEKLKSADEKAALRKELREEQAELSGYETEKKLMPAPVEVQSRTGLNVGSYSEQQFRQIFKDRSPQEIETLVKNAKAQGIIK